MTIKRPLVGEIWSNRQGHQIEIITFVHGTTHPIIGKNSRGILNKYTREGLVIAPGIQNEGDLIDVFKNDK